MYRLVAQGIIVWIGSKKLRVVAAPIMGISPSCSACRMVSRIPRASCRARHSASDRSRYFSVTISRIGPTFWAMPPWTSTRLSWSAWRVASEASSRPRIWWLGSRRPRLTPYSGSPSAASTPWMSFIPGQTPPESCQPPPEPANHSPRIARAATSRRSCSASCSVSDAA